MRTSLARSAALRAASRRARFARRRPRIPRQGAAEHLPKVFLGASLLGFINISSVFYY